MQVLTYSKVKYFFYQPAPLPINSNAVMPIRQATFRRPPTRYLPNRTRTRLLYLRPRCRARRAPGTASACPPRPRSSSNRI